MRKLVWLAVIVAALFTGYAVAYAMKPAVPLVKGYAEGQDILFQHTEVSDPQVAELLTEMMKSPVLIVPELAQVSEFALAKVYVFKNGLRGEGPFKYQSDVFDHPPGTPGYRPLRSIHIITWKQERSARLLKAASEVLDGRAGGRTHDRAAGGRGQHAAGDVARGEALGRQVVGRAMRSVGPAVLLGALIWSLSAGAMAASLITENDGLRIEVRSEPQRPLKNRKTSYSVRVVNAAGEPVADARLTLTGRMADGMSVAAPLRPASEPGMYRGEVLFMMEGRWDLTVRIVSQGQRRELLLREEVDR